MATELGEGTKVTLDLKTIGNSWCCVFSRDVFYVAKRNRNSELPEPTISRTEYDLKDRLIRKQS